MLCPPVPAPMAAGSEADSEGSEERRQWEQLPCSGARSARGCSVERLSKTLSGILRHSGRGISVDLDGFAPLEQVMALLPGRTLAEVWEVVRTSAKGGRSRFELLEQQDGGHLIRATRGHTLGGVRPSGGPPACTPLPRRHPPQALRSLPGGEPPCGRPAWAPGGGAADAGAGTAPPPTRAAGGGLAPPAGGPPSPSASSAADGGAAELRARLAQLEGENQALRAENERLRQQQRACPSASSAGSLREPQGRTLPLVPVVEPFEGPRYGEEYLELQRGDRVRRLPHPDADASWAFASLEVHGWLPEELLRISEREAARAPGVVPAGPPPGPGAAGGATPAGPPPWPAPAGGAMRWTQCSLSGQPSWRSASTGETRVGPPPAGDVVEF